MKKNIFIILLIVALLIIVKYFISDYSLEYKINGYNIISNYKNNRLYTEISKDDYTYNFDSYISRNIKKYKITNIVEIDGEDFKCIYPKIDGINTYPLCYQNNIYTDFNIIDSELLDKYKTNNENNEEKNNFTYFNNLSGNEYVALWNYKGFYIMNKNNFKNIELFKNDRYDNTLTYLYKDTLYIADYDSEHTYNKLILLNIKTQKKSEINLKYDIDFDSYFVGSIKNNIYIYDNKYSILYEFNTKNNEINIKCNNETGYVKYYNNEFISCSKSEYKIDKITYGNNNSIYKYEYNNGIYKIINDNKKIKQLINNNKIQIIKEKENDLYYIQGNYLYKYNPLNNKKILYYSELEFNSNNMILIYFNN